MALSPKSQRQVTIKDVARLAATSTTTVSYVLSNEKRYIRPELRERVLQAAAEIGYVRNVAASSIRGKKKKVMAVVVAQFGNTFFTRMCEDIVSLARPAGYVVMLCNSDEDPHQEKEILARLIEQRIDGCIICPALSQPENIDLLRRQHIPYVILERTVPGDFTHHNFVGHDNFQSGYIAARHLLEAGHRRIAFLGWDSPIPNVRDREDGYRAALQEFGVPAEEVCVLIGELSAAAGKRMAGRLPENVTAAVLAHHDIAKGALLYFQSHAIRWPDDISLVMTGTPEWTGVLLPQMTCVMRPEKQMAAAAARILKACMINPERPSEQAIFQSQIIAGQSVRVYGQ